MEKSKALMHLGIVLCLIGFLPVMLNAPNIISGKELQSFSPVFYIVAMASLVIGMVLGLSGFISWFRTQLKAH